MTALGDKFRPIVGGVTGFAVCLANGDSMDSCVKLGALAGGSIMAGDILAESLMPQAKWQSEMTIPVPYWMFQAAIAAGVGAGVAVANVPQMIDVAVNPNYFGFDVGATGSMALISGAAGMGAGMGELAMASSTETG